MNIEIATRLQKLRKEKGYSQEQLAEELGISRQAVSKWERAESSPDTDNLICLAKLYGISLDELLSTDDSIQTIKEEQIVNDKIAYDEMNEEALNVKPKSKVVEIVNGITALVISIIYFVISAIWGIWHPAWILFMFIPIIISFTEAIAHKDGHKFAYPVLAAALYLFFSFEFGLWHPLWVIFLTIPIYYIICDAIFGKKEQK